MVTELKIPSSCLITRAPGGVTPARRSMRRLAALLHGLLTRGDAPSCAPPPAERAGPWSVAAAPPSVSLGGGVGDLGVSSSPTHVSGGRGGAPTPAAPPAGRRLFLVANSPRTRRRKGQIRRRRVLEGMGMEGNFRSRQTFLPYVSYSSPFPFLLTLFPLPPLPPPPASTPPMGNCTKCMTAFFFYIFFPPSREGK